MMTNNFRKVYAMNTGPHPLLFFLVKRLKKQAVAFLLSSFNYLISKTTFPSILKQANITPDFKKGDRNLKVNYGPVSYQTYLKYLSVLYFNKLAASLILLSKFQCGFRKGYSSRHCLLSILEKWKGDVYKGESFGALLTDLSKAFDWLSHELLLAKLHAYGLSISALRFDSQLLKK